MCQFNCINGEKIFIFQIKSELYLFTNGSFMDTVCSVHADGAFEMQCKPINSKAYKAFILRMLESC